MRPEDALNLGQPDDVQPFDLLEVASLNSEDGTVNLWYGDQLIEGVPADTSYVNRKAGDVVRVDKGLLSWRVRGPVGPAASSGTVTWGSVKGKPTLAGVTYGEGNPGAGWVAGMASGIFVKGNQLYVQVPTGGGSGGSSGEQVPDSVPIAPSARVVYQGGHRTTAINGGKPVQGSYGYLPANTGAWFYGSDIVTAAGKGTVDGIDVWLARSGSGGNPRGVAVHLYLVAEGSPPYATPAISSLWTPSNKLTQNEDAHFQLPANYVSALTSGSSKGLAVFAQGPDYIRFRDCGGLTVTYK